MIAFTSYPFDPRVRREAEALAARGDQVELICLRRSRQPRREVDHGVDVTRCTLCRRTRGGSAFLYLLDYLSFFLYSFAVITWRHLHRPYQLIQVHTMPDFLVFAAIVPRLLGARILLDVHDLMPELYSSKYGVGMGHLLIRLLTWIERRAVAFSHGAIAVHEPHLDALVQHGNPRDRFVTLLNLLDERLLARPGRPAAGGGPPDQESDAFRLFYHGTLENRYGLDVALRATALLEPLIPNLRFLIVGEGGIMDELIRLAGVLGLRGVWFSRSWFPLEELLPLIRRSDLGVVPIRIDGFADKAIPTKLMEYVSLGVPVVTTRLKAVERYFSDDMVRYFRADDVEDLAAQILDLYRRPEERAALAARARAFTERYNWKVQIHTYYELVDRLCAARTRRVKAALRRAGTGLARVKLGGRQPGSTRGRAERAPAASKR